MESHDNVSDNSSLDSVQAALLRSERLALAGRFAGAVMHEVNNPLEALSNLVYLAKHEAAEMPVVRSYLEQAEQQMAHVQDIARRTLSFYRPIAATEQIDLVDLLDSALKMQRPQLLTKKIEVRRCHPVHASVKADAGELLQVFTNLIANSVDALPDEGTLHVRVRRSGEHVHILIADNGCGIPPAQRERLFEPFATSKKGKGTGLGLWMSKTLVEKHRGRIRHRSSTEHGRRGTAFRVSLPS